MFKKKFRPAGLQSLPSESKLYSLENLHCTYSVYRKMTNVGNAFFL
jgi:hypothetical protein